MNKNGTTLNEAKFRYLPMYVFFAVYCSKLYFISLNGSDIPFWDQWIAEGAGLYRPLQLFGVGGVDWFANHNEHRILLTRVTASVLFWLNGNWDPYVQVVFNSFIHAACAAYLSFIARGWFVNSVAAASVQAVILIGFALPFGWENTIAGFQSQFYYLILLSLIIFWKSCNPQFEWKWAAWFTIATVLVLFTIANGAITDLIAALILAYVAVTRKKPEFFAFSGIAAALGICGILMVVRPPDQSFTVTTAEQFFTFLLKLASWPSPPVVGVIIWLPTLATVPSIVTGKLDRNQLFFLSLAAFSLLTALILAYSRGNYDPQSRYFDLCWFGWLANIGLAFSGKGRVSFVAGVSITVICLISLTWGTQGEIQKAGDRHAKYETQIHNVQKYLQTGDIAALTVSDPLDIPFYAKMYLASQLDDPVIRQILPPSLSVSGEKGGLRVAADLLVSWSVPAGILITLAFVLSAFQLQIYHFRYRR
ncbi:hypothetical protein [Phyllobacterium calauticae]|uniref:hypothetical protein n=1 Tax=Phyllobacterium calauticae TaxID=2817027 RepID=UPI001CBC9F43|nr:hypothetical protein [Phyllobacterium calauticae]MBZ3694042.1 hypothetical protein [Phyllobacterium calauticae]